MQKLRTKVSTDKILSAVPGPDVQAYLVQFRSIPFEKKSRLVNNIERFWNSWYVYFWFIPILSTSKGISLGPGVRVYDAVRFCRANRVLIIFNFYEKLHEFARGSVHI
jgi:hypothetical protein